MSITQRGWMKSSESVSPPSLGINRSLNFTWHFTYTVSLVLGLERDVCKKDSDAGVDLITPLSSIITKDINPVCAALGLESLTALCQDDAVDFKTAWGVIGQTLDQVRLILRPSNDSYLWQFTDTVHDRRTDLWFWRTSPSSFLAVPLSWNQRTMRSTLLMLCEAL